MTTNAPTPGPVGRAIARARKPETKRRAHHAAVVDAIVDLEEWTTPEGVRFLVTQPPRIDPETGTVAVNLLAAKDGELLPGIDNPYLFDYPPFRVHDGTDVVEDPAAAFRLAVADVVLGQARRAGWTA